MNKIINNTKSKRKDLPEKLVTNNTTVVEKLEIAENLNKYFTTIGPNLAYKIATTNKEVLKNIQQIVTLF